MTTEEEVQQENKYLRERVRLQQEKIELQQRLLEQQETLLTQQHALIEGLLTQVGLLEEQVQVLQERLNKDSHNSHLPPSSDRFGRQPGGIGRHLAIKYFHDYLLNVVGCSLLSMPTLSLATICNMYLPNL